MKNKTQQAEYNIRHKLGYTIEYCRSPRGNKICKAIKEGEKTIYATNLISLEKLLTNNTEPTRHPLQTVCNTVLKNYPTLQKLLLED